METSHENAVSYSIAVKLTFFVYYLRYYFSTPEVARAKCWDLVSLSDNQKLKKVISPYITYLCYNPSGNVDFILSSLPSKKGAFLKDSSIDQRNRSC